MTSKKKSDNQQQPAPGGSLVWTIVYVLFLVVGNFFINLNITTSICGETQWNNTLMLTLLPWIVIFGIIALTLEILPGWLSPFSNTIGYGITKFMGVTKLMNNLLKTQGLGEEPMDKDLALIYSDQSLLINEITPFNFENFWSTLHDSDLINDTVRANPSLLMTYENSLYNFVIFKKRNSQIYMVYTNWNFSNFHYL